MFFGGVFWMYYDMEFQVDVLIFGFCDCVLFFVEDDVFVVCVGFSWFW